MTMPGKYSRAMQGALVAAALWAGCMSAAMSAELTASDYAEIQQLYARYNQAIDKGDADGWADTFTADGKFINFQGREALKGFINSWRTNPQMNGPARRHFSADLVLTPSAEGATGLVSAMLIDLSTRPASVASYINYNDVLVKTPQGWRFKSRAISPQTAPAAAAPAAAAPAPAR
jgi:uncharacterized protein (TIGR02246 family)